MTGDLPAVAVHDLVIHPRDHDLILGTHGRSIYICSVNELQQLHDSIFQKKIYLFSADKIDYRNSWGEKEFYWDTIKGPKIKIPAFMNQSAMVEITVYGDSTLILNKLNFDGVMGLNYFTYDLSIDSMILSNYETVCWPRNK